MTDSVGLAVRIVDALGEDAVAGTVRTALSDRRHIARLRDRLRADLDSMDAARLARIELVIALLEQAMRA